METDDHESTIGTAMNCHACAADNPLDARFRSSCGVRIVDHTTGSNAAIADPVAGTVDHRGGGTLATWDGNAQHEAIRNDPAAMQVVNSCTHP